MFIFDYNSIFLLLANYLPTVNDNMQWFASFDLKMADD